MLAVAACVTPCRAINDTAVSANVSCPLVNNIEALPKHSDHSEREHLGQQEQQRQTPRYGAASAAATMAGLAACGAGWLLWRRRRQRQRRGRQRDADGVALLPLTLRRLGDSATNSSSSAHAQRGSSSLAESDSSSGTNSWQKRMNAILSTRPGKIQLLPLDALGQALAHELLPQSGGGGPPASVLGGMRQAASTLQREWRLATESLRVTRGELEVSAVKEGADGLRLSHALRCAHTACLAPGELLAEPCPPPRLPARLLQFIADPEGGLTVLGTGSHAVVYLARLNGQQVAVKVRQLSCCWWLFVPRRESEDMAPIVMCLTHCRPPAAPFCTPGV